MAITTTAEYKTWAGITVPTDDTHIGTLVTAAQEELEKKIGYALDGAERTEDYHGAAGQEIVLKARPVVSITSVKPLGADSVLGTAWDTTAYKIDLESGILSLTPRQEGRFTRDDFGVNPEPYGEFGTTPAFADEFLNVRVVYKAGWGGSGYASVPTWLKRRIWKIIDAMYLSDKIMTEGGPDKPPDVDTAIKVAATELERYYP